jgi:hypothetical protein
VLFESSPRIRRIAHIILVILFSIENVDIKLICHPAKLVGLEFSEMRKTSANAEVFPFVAPLTAESCNTFLLLEITNILTNLLIIIIMDLLYRQ